MSGSHIKLQQRVDLGLEHGHAFQQLLRGHGPHHAIRPGGHHSRSGGLTSRTILTHGFDRTSQKSMNHIRTNASFD